jgi:surface protein
MDNMFNGASAFNNGGSLSIASWNTGAVENMVAMFFNAPAFNQPIGSWNTVSVNNMSSMFYNAFAFQQYIGTWDISNVTDFTSFMAGKTPATWPTAYFDNLLCFWSPQTVVPSLTIDFGTASYTNATGGPCRTVLQGAPKLWTITSGPGV